MIQFSFEREMRHRIDLTDQRSIEEGFLSIVERTDEIETLLGDDIYLAFMKYADGAVRDGKYGVTTPRGKGCMHFLSLECQLGLVLLFLEKMYSPEKTYEITISLAAKEIWAWLSSRLDCKIVIPKNELLKKDTLLKVIEILEYLIRHGGLGLNGKVLQNNLESVNILYEEVIAAEKYYCGMDKDTENVMYQSFCKCENEFIFCDLKETLPFDKFLKRISFSPIKEHDFHDYQMINMSEKLDVGVIGVAGDSLGLFILGEREGGYELCIEAVRPQSAEKLLLEDILEKYTAEYGQFYVLITQGESLDSYRDVYHGLEVFADQKKMFFYHRILAVKRYHELFKKCKALSEKSEKYSSKWEEEFKCFISKR